MLAKTDARLIKPYLLIGATALLALLIGGVVTGLGLRLADNFTCFSCGAAAITLIAIVIGVAYYASHPASGISLGTLVGILNAVGFAVAVTCCVLVGSSSWSAFALGAGAWGVAIVLAFCALAACAWSFHSNVEQLEDQDTRNVTRPQIQNTGFLPAGPGFQN